MINGNKKKYIMKKLKNIIMKTEKKSVRIKYIPYSLNLAKFSWYAIAKKIREGKNVIAAKQNSQVWEQLIKYAHADDSCEYDLYKSIFLCGMTGSGKTFTMNILHEYLKIDNVKYYKNNKLNNFNFKIINSREIVADYQKSGYDGLIKYTGFNNICIDDLGSEPETSHHFGTKLDVINEIIEIRYKNNKLTHYTTNLKIQDVAQRYNDRVYSRIMSTCNIVILNDADFRLL